MLSYQDYYDCCENVRQHSQFERYLSEIILDKQKREQFYDTIPDSRWLFFYLKSLTPWWFHRVQEGLNIKLEDVENIPLHYF